MGFYEFFGVTTPFDPDCTFVSSHILSPLALGVFRLALAIYTLVALVFILVWNGTKLHNLDTFFSYFTNLCYVGMCAYFWASAVQTLAFSSRLRKAAAAKARPTEGREYPLQQWPRFLQLLHVFLACTIFVFPFVVTIVFWALLADGAFSSEFNSWKNISVHALNAAFALLEILFSRIVPQWSNIPILILVLGGYIGVAYITHATQGFYTYSFLDPSHGTGKLVGYIVGIPVAAIIILAIIKGVCWVRDKIFARRAPRPQDDEYHLREKGSRV
ncbi:hypothetical protein FRC01_010239 [Tulasnella sp. 417]|nr:hypothetical protein FRC01_010239 [Tulasnella sp. 417]